MNLEIWDRRTLDGKWFRWAVVMWRPSIFDVRDNPFRNLIYTFQNSNGNSLTLPLPFSPCLIVILRFITFFLVRPKCRKLNDFFDKYIIFKNYILRLRQIDQIPNSGHVLLCHYGFIIKLCWESLSTDADTYIITRLYPISRFGSGEGQEVSG